MQLITCPPPRTEPIELYFRLTMSDSNPTRMSCNASQRLDLFLAEVELQNAADADEQFPAVRRMLIDYTVTNRAPIRSDSEQERQCVTAGKRIATDIPPSHHVRKLPTSSHLPSFASLERIPYGSMKMASDESHERIDFFLKIQPRRASGSRINELRAGLNKKSRSTKSRLFGSFYENGEIRQSYNDLKELLRQKQQMEDGAS